MQPRHSLKKVIAIGAVKLPGQHAAVLETGDLTSTGMGRSAPISPSVACCRSLPDRHASPGSRKGNPCGAYSLPRNQNWSRCLVFVSMAHLRQISPRLRARDYSDVTCRLRERRGPIAQCQAPPRSCPRPRPKRARKATTTTPRHFMGTKPAARLAAVHARLCMYASELMYPK